MAEFEKTTKGTGKSTRRAKQTTKAPSVQRTQPEATRRKSVSFQIRTAPATKELAERVASDHCIGGRSKLDADIYKRGLLLMILLLGPSPDGTYSGLSERELARQLEPLFDRQYAVLDRNQLLSSYVYRVLPPGATGGVTFLSPELMAGLNSTTQQAPTKEQSPDDQARYQLSEESCTTLDNLPDEI